MKKRFKNMYHDKDKPKTSECFPTGKYLYDGKNSFEVYHRKKLNYYVDIPIGDNDCGIIIDKYFVYCFRAHFKTLDFDVSMKLAQQKIIDRKINIKEFCNILVESYRKRGIK